MLMVFIASCHSFSEEEALLNVPIGEEIITVAGETFKVDFRLDDVCKELGIFEVLPDDFSKLKTKYDMINYYKTLIPAFLPSYSSMRPDNHECVFARVEYILAQECFSDRCDNKTRKEVLQLAVNFHKRKNDDMNNRYSSPQCTLKTGVFLMAVILAKEIKSSAKFIDSATLQQALLFLNNDVFVSEVFSNLMIECSEKFLNNNK